MFVNTGTNSLGIDAKNVKAVKITLTEHKLSLEGDGVSSLHSRRITFNVVSGRAIVRVVAIWRSKSYEQTNQR